MKLKKKIYIFLKVFFIGRKDKNDYRLYAKIDGKIFKVFRSQKNENIHQICRKGLFTKQLTYQQGTAIIYLHNGKLVLKTAQIIKLWCSPKYQLGKK